MPRAKKIEEIPHQITEEDLENNPELFEAGVQVGETVGLPVEAEELTGNERNKTYSVYNASGGFVRAYTLENQGKEAKSLAEMYASKIGGSVQS